MLSEVNENKHILFETLIAKAMDELPEQYIKGLDNVVITTADEPDEHQLGRSHLAPGQLLLGLYEGVPLTRRTGNEIVMIPDKITLFTDALLAVSKDDVTLFEQVKRTLWHEIAHFYGLDHDRIDELERTK